MNWKKAIGLGLLLYAIMFVLVSALIGFKVYQYGWVTVVVAILGGVVSLILANYVKPGSAKMALGYGLVWVVVGVILDALITMRFNPQIFNAWTIWFSYGLVLLAPLTRVKKRVV